MEEGIIKAVLYDLARQVRDDELLGNGSCFTKVFAHGTARIQVT